MNESNLIIDLLQQILSELKELNKQPVNPTYNINNSIAKEVNEKIINNLFEKSKKLL